MTSLNRKQQGFTIVELLIVIVVIGILAGLVITTFNGIQQKGRDTERQTDIKAIYGQVEAYYAQNGYYPSLTQLNTATFRSDNLKGLDDAALKDPKGSAATLVASPVAASYAYEATPASCDNTGANLCTGYTLTATLEGKIDNQTTYVKKNLNN
jgi:general secretion pathway protein G